MFDAFIKLTLGSGESFFRGSATPFVVWLNKELYNLLDLFALSSKFFFKKMKILHSL